MPLRMISGRPVHRIPPDSMGAANFVDLESILHIEGYGECVVLDRMHRRFALRVDIARREYEVDRAIEFGVQRRYVEVKIERP